MLANLLVQEFKVFKELEEHGGSVNKLAKDHIRLKRVIEQNFLWEEVCISD